MHRRFVGELNFRFDQVEDIGFAVVTEKELLRWWERQRITRSVWQDLAERWKERFDNPLKIAQLNGRYILAWGEDGWLSPIEAWAGSSE